MPAKLRTHPDDEPPATDGPVDERVSPQAPVDGLRRCRHLRTRPRVPWVTRYSPAELARGSVGALIGIAVAAATAKVVPGGPETLPFIVAPMGAAAVLLFAVPASPLAQPWPVVGGNIISTMVGLTAHWLIDDVLLAGAVGVGAAIGVMMLLRLPAPTRRRVCAPRRDRDAGRSTSRDSRSPPCRSRSTRSPCCSSRSRSTTSPGVATRTARPAAPPPTGAAAELGLGAADIESAMARLSQRLDVLPQDVVALVQDAEAHALDRRLGSVPVERIMHTDVATVRPFESIYRARHRDRAARR